MMTVPDYTRALDGVTWYNGLADVVLSWADLQPKNGTLLSPPKEYGADPWSPEEDKSQLQVIWMIAVELFGDCGTSPRFGWIEDLDGFRKWVLEITKLWRSSDEYTGPEKYRIVREWVKI